MPAPGDRLADRYRILAPLGAGGMATVHRAIDERLDREVAIKVLLPNLAGDEAVTRRFEREARAMAAVAHPGLVAVFDVDAGDPGTGREPFVVMELCPGGSLAERMGVGRPMPPDELVPILVAIADALGALHHAGLVHRDVKPSNILFAIDRAKLADFGLVRSETGGIDAAGLTDPGTAIGTLGYLAPERLRGEPGGPPADVFALATIAHLGLTGALPRPSGSVRDLVAAAPFRAPSVSAIAPALGPAFDAIVLEGLAIDPARRPDAVELGSRLAAALGAWTRAGRPGADGLARAARSPDDSIVATASTRPRGPAREPSDPDDRTTAIALPVEPTAPVIVEAPEPPPEDPAARPEPPSRPSTRRPSWPAALLLLAVAVAAVAVVGAGLGSMLAPPAGASAGPAATRLPASGTIAPPSEVPSATPAPRADPAITALDALDAAIEAARGGRDGLKGKEANDLASRSARVRSAVEAGDRPRALTEARDLDRRVRDVTARLRGDAIDRLRAASAALVAALGG